MKADAVDHSTLSLSILSIPEKTHEVQQIGAILQIDPARGTQSA